MKKILLVDDEPDILEFVGYNLRNAGFDVRTSQNGADALAKAVEDVPDLVVLDVMMPEMSGIEVCAAMRADERLKDVLIMFLTALDEEITQIKGLEAGGDDYITKPVSPRVLLSRIKALLRRSHHHDTDTENEKKLPVSIDVEGYLVKLEDGTVMTLPRKEFELLRLLISRPGKLFLREEIYDKVWGSDVVVGDRTIDVHIRKLREKIGASYIRTVKGVGYKFVVE